MGMPDHGTVLLIAPGVTQRLYRRLVSKFDRAPVDRAAGGVVVADDGRVLVVHRPRYDDWALPKGHVERGESWAEAACREVLEETGLTAVIEGPPTPIAYALPDGTPKIVVFFPMSVDPAVPESSDLDDEVDVVAWCSVSEIAERLSYRIEAQVVADSIGRSNPEE